MFLEDGLVILLLLLANVIKMFRDTDRYQSQEWNLVAQDLRM